jgi:hypothetical protein
MSVSTIGPRVLGSLQNASCLMDSSLVPAPTFSTMKSSLATPFDVGKASVRMRFLTLVMPRQHQKLRRGNKG